MTNKTVDKKNVTNAHQTQQHNPTVPADLQAIVEKGMAKDLKTRFQTAQEFASALDQFLNNHAQGFNETHLSRFLTSLFKSDIEKVFTTTTWK